MKPTVTTLVRFSEPPKIAATRFASEPFFLGLPVNWPATNLIQEKTICSRPLRSVSIYFHFLVGVVYAGTVTCHNDRVPVTVIASLS